MQLDKVLNESGKKKLRKAKGYWHLALDSLGSLDFNELKDWYEFFNKRRAFREQERIVEGMGWEIDPSYLFEWEHTYGADVDLVQNLSRVIADLRQDLYYAQCRIEELENRWDP